MCRFVFWIFLIAGVASTCDNRGDKTIVRPCKGNQISCVRSFIRKYNDKGPRTCEYKNQLFLPSFNIYLPYFNMTVVQNDLTIKGLDDAIIEDFYVNSRSNKIILVLGFKDVIFTATTSFGYHAKGKEVQNVVTNNTELYPFVSTTTIFDIDVKASLANSATQAEVNSTLIYDIGEGVRCNKDSEIQKRFKFFDEHVDIAVLDCFFTRGPLMASYFIQNHISDFGLDYTYINFSALNNI